MRRSAPRLSAGGSLLNFEMSVGCADCFACSADPLFRSKVTHLVNVQAWPTYFWALSNTTEAFLQRNLLQITLYFTKAELQIAFYHGLHSLDLLCSGLRIEQIISRESKEPKLSSLLQMRGPSLHNTSRIGMKLRERFGDSSAMEHDSTAMNCSSSRTSKGSTSGCDGPEESTPLSRDASSFSMRWVKSFPTLVTPSSAQFSCVWCKKTFNRRCDRK